MADDLNDRDAIRAALENMSRLPFRRELAVLLENPTDPEALKAWANKSPDRRGQLLAILGRLSGYTEKLELDSDVSITARIQEMSMSQLMAEIARMEAKIGVPPRLTPEEWEEWKQWKALQASPEQKALKPAPKRKQTRATDL